MFAAAVPNNWGRNLRQLVNDVYEDHRAMKAKAAAQAAQAAAAGEGEGTDG